LEGWSTVSTAPDQIVGEMLRVMLEENGVVAMIQPEDVISFLGVSSIPCRIMVPDEQLEVARQLVAEFEQSDTDWEDEEPDDGVEEEKEPDDIS